MRIADRYGALSVTKRFAALLVTRFQLANIVIVAIHLIRHDA